MVLRFYRRKTMIMFKQTLRTLGIFSCLLLAVSMAGGMVNAADSTQAQIDALQDAVGELKQSVNKMGGDTLSLIHI